MKKTNKKPRSSIAHSRARLRALHRRRIALFGLLFLALVLVRSDSGILQATSQPSNGQVLAYATSMSRTDLFNATNAFRTQNGLAPLSLDSQLNTSAQGKAQHMVTHDYWAHDAPDGTTPWYFFDQAGYSYSKAGENLAYGYNTSQEAVNGWIASASHRANMLGDYADVGFGYVNGANYQGGPYTVVVAHYGTRVAPPPAPAAPAPAPAPTPSTPAPVAPVQSTPPPASTQPAPEKNKPKAVEPTEQKTEEPLENQTPPPVAVAATRNVSFLEQLRSGRVQVLAAISALLVVSSLAGFALTHRSLVSHAALAGEHFVMKHPLVDTTVVVGLVALILTTTVGRIG